MATTVDTILVKVEADLKDVKKSLNELDKRTKTATRGAGRAMENMGRVFKAVLGAVVVREFARGAIAATNFASHVEEMQAKSSVVFGQFTQDVRKELGSFADAVGRSRFELEEMAAQVQDTFVPLGFARGEAADLSVQLTKLATDVASFQNASDPEVMKAFQSALVGNHETVRRFGIVIGETELKAELFRMGITKNIDAVSAQEKVQARLNLILAGTTDAHGDAARTSDSYANRVRALQAAVDELQLAIGQRLMPAMKEFVELFTDMAKDSTEVVKGQRSIGEALMGWLLPSLRYMVDNNVKVRKFKEGTDEAADSVNNLANAGKKLQETPIVPKLTDVESAKLEEALRKLRIENEALNAVKLSGNEIDGQIIEARRAISDTQAAELDQIDEIIRKNEQLRISIENQKIVMDTVKNATIDFGNSLSQELAEGLANGEFALDDFKSIARSFVTQLIAEFIRLQVINQILNSIFNLSGTPNALPTGNIFGGGGSSGAMVPMPRPAGATGGTVQRGQPTLVGERGPEILIPNAAASLMNSNNTRSALGGTSVVVNQNINVSTGVSQTVRAELLNFLPVIKNQTLTAVAQAKSKGGRMAEVL